MTKYLKNIKPYSIILATGNSNGLTVDFKPKEAKLYSDLVVEDRENSNFNSTIYNGYIDNNILTLLEISSTQQSLYTDNVLAMTQDPVPYNGGDGTASYNAGDISGCFTYTPLNVEWQMSTDGWFFPNVLQQGVPVGTPGGWQPAKFIELNPGNPGVGGTITFFDGSTLNPFWNSSYSIPCPEPSTALTVQIADLTINADGITPNNFVPNFIRAIVTRPDGSTTTFESLIGIGTISTEVSGADVTFIASGFTCPSEYTLNYNIYASTIATGSPGGPISNNNVDGNNQIYWVEKAGTYYITVDINMLDSNNNTVSTLVYTPPYTFTTTVDAYTAGTITQSLIGDASTWTFSGFVSNSSMFKPIEYIVDTGWPTQLISSSTRIISTTSPINYTYPTSNGNGPFYATAWATITDINNNIIIDQLGITYNAITL